LAHFRRGPAEHLAGFLVAGVREPAQNCPLLGGLCILLPLLIALNISLVKSVIGIPPYAPLVRDNSERIKILVMWRTFFCSPTMISTCAPISVLSPS
jgi:hypothetical protein